MAVSSAEVIDWLPGQADEKRREDMPSRFNIPNEEAFGVAMGEMRDRAKKIGPDHALPAALAWIADAPADDRPLVKKAVNMALRAVGKRNATLNGAALATAEALTRAEEPSRSWIGRHARRELSSEKVQARLR